MGDEAARASPGSPRYCLRILFRREGHGSITVTHCAACLILRASCWWSVCVPRKVLLRSHVFACLGLLSKTCFEQWIETRSRYARSTRKPVVTVSGPEGGSIVNGIRREPVCVLGASVASYFHSITLYNGGCWARAFAICAFLPVALRRSLATLVCARAFKETWEKKQKMYANY